MEYLKLILSCAQVLRTTLRHKLQCHPQTMSILVNQTHQIYYWRMLKHRRIVQILALDIPQWTKVGVITVMSSTKTRKTVLMQILCQYALIQLSISQLMIAMIPGNNFNNLQTKLPLFFDLLPYILKVL